MLRFTEPIVGPEPTLCEGVPGISPIHSSRGGSMVVERSHPEEALLNSQVQRFYGVIISGLEYFAEEGGRVPFSVESLTYGPQSSGFQNVLHLSSGSRIILSCSSNLGDITLRANVSYVPKTEIDFSSWDLPKGIDLDVIGLGTTLEQTLGDGVFCGIIGLFDFANAVVAAEKQIPQPYD